MSEVTSDLHEYSCRIDGKDIIIKIKKDLTWGEVQELINKSTRVLENGSKDFLFSNFCDILLAKTVTGFPFDSANLVKMRALPMSVVSGILGEIMKVIPLEDYFKNLGMSNQLPQKI